MLPEATWTVAESNPIAEELASELGVSEIVARCLANRYYTDADSARSFLNVKLSNLDIPKKMVDLDRAVDRTARAIMGRERIGVFGDYDVDGMSSVALLASFFEEINVDSTIGLADRFLSGYGLGVEAVDQFATKGCSLLIVFDCGTSDHDAVERASEKGIDVIIIDHHTVEGKHPQVLAFVNPQRKDCLFADKTMAAVGLAFYFASSLKRELVDRRYIEKDSFDPKSLLDFVALGTVADVVPLKKNNRILVRHGLKMMLKNKRPGLMALLKSARIRAQKLRSDHISFQLAPRLNAAGRLESADLSLELLTSKSSKDTEGLAQKLEVLTQERRTIEEYVTKAAKQQAAQIVETQKVIVVSGDDWHRGVIGIVAARLCEEYGKPAFVIGFTQEVGTGSARGSGQINIHDALAHSSEHLIRFGGHRDAAGFTVKKMAVTALKERLIAFGDEHWSAIDEGEIVCDARLNSAQLNPELLRDLEALRPFGNGNREPIFEIMGLHVLASRVVGTNHLKMELKTPSGSVSVFGPRMGMYAEVMPPMIKVAATVNPDEWRGRGNTELKLVCPPVADDQS